MLFVLCGVDAENKAGITDFLEKSGFLTVKEYKCIGVASPENENEKSGYVSEDVFLKNTDPLLRFETGGIKVGFDRQHVSVAFYDTATWLVVLPAIEEASLLKARNSLGDRACFIDIRLCTDKAAQSSENNLEYQKTFDYVISCRKDASRSCILDVCCQLDDIRRKKFLEIFGAAPHACYSMRCESPPEVRYSEHNNGADKERTIPPPPPLASYSSPCPDFEVGYGRCVQQDYMPRKKRGLFGLFKRRKKAGFFNKKEKTPPPLRVDSVRFSAVAPNKVEPGKYIPINVVMYESGFRSIVEGLLGAYKNNAKESTSGYHDVTQNSTVKVVLSSSDITIEDNVNEAVWNGKYLNFEFAAKIPRDFAGEQVLLTATVYVNNVIATKLKLILDCKAKPKRNVSVTRFDVVSAFVSYASQDRNQVAAVVQGMKKARPDMDIFFDVEYLRSGQRWEDALKQEIADRDILFLCWSKHAKDSKWVDMEWRYALENKGEDCIEPIPIDSPDICPPPEELKQKHFNDLMLYIIKTPTHQQEKDETV